MCVWGPWIKEWVSGEVFTWCVGVTCVVGEDKGVGGWGKCLRDWCLETGGRWAKMREVVSVCGWVG